MKRYLAILAALIFTLSAFASDELDVKALDAPKVLPEFNLFDHNGEAFGLDRLKGQWSMVFLGFTSCPHVCPTTLRRLEAIRAELSLRLTPEAIPNIVFLAVDPQRDQPELRAYIERFHPANIGVTGNPKEIGQLVEGLGGFYRIKKRYEGEANYTVLHSSTVYIVNPEAQLVARMNPPFKAHATGDYLAGIIRKSIML